MNKKYLINGPNNVIRLQKDNKVVYIFGFLDMPIEWQTDCGYGDFESIDIDKFMLNFIKSKDKKNKTYDLFIDMPNKKK